MAEFIFENIIEAVRSLCPNHIIINCLTKDGIAIRHQKFNYILLSDSSIGIINCTSSDFYRGESSVHKTCFPSLYRISDYETKIVSLLKTYDFQLFLESTNEIKEWRNHNFHLDLWAICQHYDFATPMIDITFEIAVAAFFATHDFDWRINQYILKKDGVGQLIKYSETPEKEGSHIKLIGMQPFDRPGNQDGAGLWLESGKDMLQNSTVIKFKQDYEVNLRLERAMLCGSDVFFPYEPLTEIAHLIKSKNIVTNAAIDRFYQDAEKWLKNVPDKNQLQKILKSKNIQIVDAPLALGFMMGEIQPPVYEGARKIFQRPVLDKYLNLKR